MDCKLSSTGYDIEIPIDVRENVKKAANVVFPDINYIMYNNYRSMIMYHDTFKIGYDRSCLGNIFQLNNWFSGHKYQSYSLVISCLYITRNVIIGEGYIGREKIYVVFSNMNGSSTLSLKKNVSSGLYGPPHILPQTISLSAKPYIYDVDKKDN